MPSLNKNNGHPTDHATDPPYQGANGRDISTRIIRCLHTDPARHQLPEDQDTERHWRCPARFDCLESERPYCPYHAHLYVPGPPASAAEVEQAMTALLPYLRHVTQSMPAVRADYDDEDL